MPRLYKGRRPRTPARMFETRSEAWAAVGLEADINRQEARSSMARLPAELLLLAGVIVGRDWLLQPHTHHLRAIGIGGRGGETASKLVAVLLVLSLGWLISRDLAKVGPALFRRMDPATAGTVEFTIRFLAVAATVLAALAVAGTSLQAIAVGGGFAAVIFGLAA